MYLYRLKLSLPEAMPMTLGKPDTLTFKWLSGLLITIVMTLLGFWARDVSTQIKDVGVSVTVLREGVTTQGKSVSNIEGQLPAINARLKRIEDNQDRIEARRPR